MTDRPDLELSIPARPEYVALARHVVGATARLGSLSPDSVDNVKLAVSEAVTNAVTATERSSRADPVEVRAELEEDRLHVWVADRAESRAGSIPASVHEPDGGDPDSLDSSFERGLSLPLLEGLVDDLEIADRDGGGTLVRMTLMGGEPSPLA